MVELCFCYSCCCYYFNYFSVLFVIILLLLLLSSLSVIMLKSECVVNCLKYLISCSVVLV